MTPEERRELAERLDRAAALNERTAKVMGSLGRGWANAAADLRAAAAALREDADMRQRAAARLLRACEAERERDELRERLADAVVIPRSAIPDDLPGDLLEMAEEVSECRRVLGDHDRLVTAARLLSGGATEGRTCWPEEGT